MNSSATGGYILSDGGAVPNDQALEDIFQDFIQGVTGIAGAMVRPRFQEKPPPFPAVGVDWVAFGVKTQRLDESPYFEQREDDASSIRHETIELALSFYGNNGQSFADRFTDGTAIPQNIEQLKLHKIKFIEVGDVLTAPDLLNEQYVHRFDVTAIFRRKKVRTYPVQSFLDLSEIKTNQN